MHAPLSLSPAWAAKGLALGGGQLQLAESRLCHQMVEQAESQGAPRGRHTAVTARPAPPPNFIGLCLGMEFVSVLSYPVWAQQDDHGDHGPEQPAEGHMIQPPIPCSDSKRPAFKKKEKTKCQKVEVATQESRRRLRSGLAQSGCSLARHCLSPFGFAFWLALAFAKSPSVCRPWTASWKLAISLLVPSTDCM